MSGQDESYQDGELLEGGRCDRCGQPDSAVHHRYCPDRIAEEAVEAFWQVVADSHPGVRSGDLDPMDHARFSEVTRQVVTAWQQLNAADLIRRAERANGPYTSVEGDEFAGVPLPEGTRVAWDEPTGEHYPVGLVLAGTGGTFAWMTLAEASKPA